MSVELTGKKEMNIYAGTHNNGWFHDGEVIAFGIYMKVDMKMPADGMNVDAMH